MQASRWGLVISEAILVELYYRLVSSIPAGCPIQKLLFDIKSNFNFAPGWKLTLLKIKICFGRVQ